MSRLVYGDFHDHANDGFNSTLNGLSVKGIDFMDFAATVDATLKKKFTASVDVNQFKKDYFLAATVKATCAGEIKPTVTYEKGEHKFVTSYADRTLKYQNNKLPAIGGAITTKVLDGLCSELWASTVLSDVCQAGFAASYDPSRSGLKKLSYGIRAQSPSWFKKGTVSWSCDGPNAYRFGVSYACCSGVLVSALIDQTFQGSYGFRLNSFCGATVTAYANAKRDGDYGCPSNIELGTTINKKWNGTKFTVGALINPSTMENKFGLKVAL